MDPKITSLIFPCPQKTQKTAHEKILIRKVKTRSTKLRFGKNHQSQKLSLDHILRRPFEEINHLNMSNGDETLTLGCAEIIFNGHNTCNLHT